MISKKPNVLLIYPDQLRYDAMGNSGNKAIKTPAFDRLSCEGVNFRNAYTSFPLCSPFRASIFTGKYAHCHGMGANHYPIDTEKNHEFLPEIFNYNGYKTGWVGKWHLGAGNKSSYVKPEYRCGFESFVGFTRGHNYKDSVYYRQNDETPLKNNMYEPEYQTGHLFEFIEEALDENMPFFAGICYGLPHPPFIEDAWYMNLYSPDEMEPSSLVPEEDRHKVAGFLAKYYGLVTCVDNQLTRIINYLDENGLADDTMVVLVSDHGEMAGEHGLYDKKVFYDASMHVPFIIRYGEKFGKGRDVSGLADPSVDIFPTLLDVCGIEIPEYVQGKSLLPYLDNSSENVREEIFYQLIKMNHPDFEENVLNPQRGVRTGEYLYISQNDEPYKLFDLNKDPDETDNLVDNEAYSDILKKLDVKMHSLMEEYEDHFDIVPSFSDQLPEGYVFYEIGDAYAKELFTEAVLDIPSRHRKYKPQHSISLK